MLSPVYQKYDSGEDLDPQVDFAEVLKEARMHVSRDKAEAGTLHPSEDAGLERLGGRTKPKKSWKSSLFPWLRAGKKSSKIITTDKHGPQSNSSCNTSKPKKGYVSGPIHGIKSCSAGRPWRPASGPLAGLFNPTKTIEDDAKIPYMSLAQLNNSPALRSYGPVYLVT